jgi:hypothetical protein
MKTQRHPILSIIYLCCMLYCYYLAQQTGNSLIFLGTSFLICSPFIVSFFIRKYHWSEPYFTSSYNFSTEKVRFTKDYTIPKELLLEKTVEVIKDSKFKIQNIDKEQLKIFATSGLSMNSVGENIYISFSEKEDYTNMNFCCTTIQSFSSWGRNRKNINKLINQIEESLII